MADIKTTIVNSPAAISFAGNPLIYAVATNKALGTDESFLRIVCKFTFSLNGNVDWYQGNVNFSDELSQPVRNYGGTSFNLSDAAQTLIRNVQSSIDMNGDAPLPPYGLIANVSFRTVWIYDNQEISEGEVYAPTLYVVSGRLTDFELLSMEETDLLTLASDGRALTRKPDGGVLYRGESMIVPTMHTYYDASNPEMLEDKISNFKLSLPGGKEESGVAVLSCNEVDYQVASSSAGTEDGSFTFTSDLTRTLSGYYRTNTHGVHFLRFINGFGAVENISVRSKDKLSYEVSGETHSLVQGATTRPTDRRYATKSQPVGVYELSSGYVPKKWAEWFVQELLTSPRVWIQLGGKWVPALIEAEDDCVIYDRTKPEMPHVDFTLRLAIDGVTGCTW